MYNVMYIPKKRQTIHFLHHSDPPQLSKGHCVFVFFMGTVSIVMMFHARPPVKSL